MTKGMRWDRMKYHGKPATPALPLPLKKAGAATHIKRELVTRLRGTDFDEAANRGATVLGGKFDPMTVVVAFVRDGISRSAIAGALCRTDIVDWSMTDGQPHDESWVETGEFADRRTTAILEGLRFGGESCDVEFGFNNAGEADRASIFPDAARQMGSLSQASTALDRLYGHIKSRYGEATPVTLKPPGRGYRWVLPAVEISAGLTGTIGNYAVGAFISR